MKLSSWQKGVLAILTAHLVWGVATPLVKVILNDVPPISLLYLRCLFTVVLLFPLYEFVFLKRYPKLTLDGSPITRKDKLQLFAAGFLGTFLNISAYFWGQSLTTVSDAAIIISTGTIFIAAYSYIFMKERLPKLAYTGIILAFAGTLIVIGSPLLQLGQGSGLGNLLLLVATISGAASFLIIRDLVKRFDPFVIIFMSFLISLPFTVPFMLWEFVLDPTWMTKLGASHYYIMAYLIAGSSIVAYFLSNIGLKYLPASIAAAFGYSSTIVAILLGIFFLKESPTVYFFVGGGLIMLGLILVETRHASKSQ